VKKVGTPPFFSSASWENFPPKKNIFDTTLMANFLTVGGWVTGTKGFFTRGLGQSWQEAMEKEVRILPL
jgi:hypothetical protein